MTAFIRRRDDDIFSTGWLVMFPGGIRAIRNEERKDDR